MGGRRELYRPAPGDYRLLVEEFEYVSAEYLEERQTPGRLIYAETFAVDGGLMQPSCAGTSS